MGFFKDDKPLTPKLVGPKQERKKRVNPKDKPLPDDSCMGAFIGISGLAVVVMEGIQHVV